MKKKRQTGITKRRAIYIPRPLLDDLYTKQGKTTWEIAKLLHCSQDTIWRRLKEYYIPTRSLRLDLPLEEIRRLYIQEGWGCKLIGKYLGCSHTTVAARLRDMGILRPGIPRKPKQDVQTSQIVKAYRAGHSSGAIAHQFKLSQWDVLHRLHKAREPLRGGHKRYHLDKQAIRHLYEEKKLSTTQIARLYNIKSCTVAARLREMGVVLRGNRLKLDTVEVRRQYQAGTSVMKIAERMGCSYTAISKRVYDLRLEKGSVNA